LFFKNSELQEEFKKFEGSKRCIQYKEYGLGL